MAELKEFIALKNVLYAISLWIVPYAIYFIHQKLSSWLAPPWKCAEQGDQKQKKQ